MHALAQAHDGDRYTRAANDDCIFGGPRTRTKYVYDALNRVTSINYLITGATDVSMGYDAGTNQKGRMTSVSSTSDTGVTVSRAFTYDGFGNLTVSSQTMPRPTGGDLVYTTSYTFDGADNLKTITYPSGRVVEYVRDDAGRIDQVKVTFNGGSATTMISNVIYYPFGPVKNIYFNNGLMQGRMRDADYRIANLFLTNTSNWDVLSQLNYTLDGVGNVDYIEDYADPANDRDYAYDVLNRLQWDSGVSSSNPTYTYDENGNRLTRTATVSGFASQSISYLDNTNRMNLLDGTAVSYDGMGNVTNPLPWSATYDAGGRSKSFSDGETRVWSIYNGLGELARTQHEAYDGCTNAWNTYGYEYLHFAPDGRVLGMVQDNVGRVEWDWVWIDDLPVLQFQDSYDSEGNLIGTQTTYLHPDHLGTPRLGTDTAGAIQWRYRSDAFGKATIEGTRTVRLRLPGQISLGIEGLNYNYFRDYDPNVGRYLESDPIGLHGGLNTYGYVDQNPLKNADPTGLCPFCVVIPGVCAGGACEAAVLGIGALMSTPAGRDTAKKAADAISDAAEQCDVDDDCERRWEREEKLCELVAGPRYPGNPAQAITICKKAAFQRYLKCRQGMPQAEWPPLTGVETPI